MSIDRKLRGYLLAALGIVALGIAAMVSLAAPKPPELNPAAIKIQMPDQIKWDDDMARGESTAVLAGDPNKPGIYVELVKWHAHHMSHPHFHPNDRFIYVISGTWWVGTGTKFDPDSTKPLPPGSFAMHYGKQVHWDGAKDEDTILEIVGEGPATSTPAEVK
jgi:quercetin dioxygenase-like cupin family protein